MPIHIYLANKTNDANEEMKERPRERRRARERKKATPEWKNFKKCDANGRPTACKRLTNRKRYLPI